MIKQLLSKYYLVFPTQASSIWLEYLCIVMFGLDPTE